MTIRFKRHAYKAGGQRTVMAVTITANNIHDIADHLTKKGVGAFVTTYKDKPPRLRIKQRNFGENWGKVDWRVANIGDSVVRYDFESIPSEYARVREDAFEATFEKVK